MPEEINRIVTDRLADLLLAPSRDAAETLRAEGEPDDEIEFVGNVMIDSLFFALDSARRTGFRESIGLTRGAAVVVTLHRPSNVDDPERLESIADALRRLAEELPVVFAAHPRTSQRLAEAGFSLGKTRVLQPLPYPKMLNLVEGARVVITDSGGLQEETTALGVPCLTVRENTERPVTVTEGTNTLVPDPMDLFDAAMSAKASGGAGERRPEGWDGHAADRIIEAFRTRARATSPALKHVVTI